MDTYIYMNLRFEIKPVEKSRIRGERGKRETKLVNVNVNHLS